MERKEIFQVLCEFDEDEKGFLDFNDFMRVMTDKKVAYKLPDPPVERSIFREFSSDGKVTLESLEKAYCKFGFVIGKDELQSIWKSMKRHTGEEETSSAAIDLAAFQKLLVSAHQELGLKLKEELTRL